jgi:hypothetical protein
MHRDLTSGPSLFILVEYTCINPLARIKLDASEIN